LIAVDTSVWIDFFRDTPTRQVEILIRAVLADRVGIPDMVITELLQGCDTDREFDAVRHEIAPHEIVRVVDHEVAIQAARNYRLLRARGITVRKTIDTLIATRCIIEDLPLLYSDRDFDPFVEHLGLRSAIDLDPGVN
jgi:hypothetical protein